MRAWTPPSNADGKKATHGEVSALVATLRACTKTKDLFRGTRVHEDLLKRGLLGRCSDALITMYARCGALAKASELLDIHQSRDVSAWTALIAGYAQKNQGHEALTCFETMQRTGLVADAIIFASLLKACGSIRSLDKGVELHNEIARQRLLDSDIVLGNALVDMYAKCGSLNKALQVLEKLPMRDVVTWNALIAGYTREGHDEQALNCFEQMQEEGIPPNAVTFSCLLKACANKKAALLGELIHDEIARRGLLGADIMLDNSLVDMYAKCGALAKAQQVLKELPVRDVVSWNAIISGLLQQNKGEQTVICFEQMCLEGISPDPVTFLSILKAYGCKKAAERGEWVHVEIARRGLLVNNPMLGNALVDMYGMCGALAKARCVLDELHVRTIVSWNALIAGYAQESQADQAFNCLECLQCDGLSPNAVTFSCILKACGRIGAADKGEKIHNFIARQGFLDGDVVLGNGLVDMYAKCGALEHAERVLKDLPARDIVSWNSLIAGYVQVGQGNQAVSCLESMRLDGLSPDRVTFLCILSACGCIGAPHRGEQIHEEISRLGLLGSDIMLGNAVVDMYAKCGALTKAEQVLWELPNRNVVSWSALIAGYAQQGQSMRALDCFEQMLREGLSPDSVTFLCVLNVCSHLGLVELAQIFSLNMTAKFHMKFDARHYACMVDALGRAGHLDKATEVLEKVKVFESVPQFVRALWSTVMGACVKWGDVNFGKWAFEHCTKDRET